MRAAVYNSRSKNPGAWFAIEEVERPALHPGQLLLKAIAR